MRYFGINTQIADLGLQIRKHASKGKVGPCRGDRRGGDYAFVVCTVDGGPRDCLGNCMGGARGGGGGGCGALGVTACLPAERNADGCAGQSPAGQHCLPQVQPPAAELHWFQKPSQVALRASSGLPLLRRAAQTGCCLSEALPRPSQTGISPRCFVPAASAALSAVTSPVKQNIRWYHRLQSV